MTSCVCRLLAVAAAAALSFTGCGGGETDKAPTYRFKLSATAPGEHDGSLAVGPTSFVTNTKAGPDGFSAVPYCVVRFNGIAHEAGGTYDMVVAFATGNLKVLAIVLNHKATSWSVAAFSPPADEATVDTASHSIAMRRLKSTQGAQIGWQATVDGAADFPPGLGDKDCG